MDSKEVVAVLKELQTTNRFILKRLNQAQRKETTGLSDCSVESHTTACSQQKQNEEEITALRKRLEILEEKDKETNSIVDRLCLHVENLQKQVEKLKGARPSTSEEIGTHTLRDTPDKSPQALTEPVVSPDVFNIHELVHKKPMHHKGLLNYESSTLSERVVANVQPQQRESNNGSTRTNDNKPEVPHVRSEAEGQEPETPAVLERTMTSLQHGGYRLGDGSTPSTPVMEEIPGGPSSRPVIKQTEKRYYTEKQHLEMMFMLEQAKAHSGLADLGGAHTVFVLDISASMAENRGWEQMQQFFFTFLNELDKVKSKMSQEEHIAVVVFGHETKILHHLTNNFSLLKSLVGKITLGGPSPLATGFKMAITAACASRTHLVMINGFRVTTRIIVMTDGRSTEPMLYRGPDSVDQTADEMTMDMVCAKLLELEDSPTSIIFIPVGNPDMDVLAKYAGINGVKLANQFDAKKLARRTMLVSEHFLLDFDLSGIADADRVHLEELRQEFHTFHLRQSLENNTKYLEAADPKQPPVGSRVERGPDWKWGNQDEGGPGTIIGHCAGQVWVHWDRSRPNVYRYGLEGKFDVLLIDEYRKPEGGKLNVGCLVTPGRHWKGDDTFDENGVVIRVESPGHKLHVRWKSGKRGDYSHGQDGIFEVEPSRQRTVCLERVKKTTDFTKAGTKLDLSMLGAAGLSSEAIEGSGVSLAGLKEHLGRLEHLQQMLLDKDGEHGLDAFRPDSDDAREEIPSSRPVKPSDKKTKNKNKNNQ